MRKAGQILKYLFGLVLLLIKSKRETKNQQRIYLSFQHLGNTNYYCAIAIRLAQAGYAVYLLHNHRFIIDCYDPIRGRVMLKFPGIYLKFGVPASRSKHFLVHDNQPTNLDWKHVVKLSANSLPVLFNERELKEGEYVYPFDIHLRQFDSEKLFDDTIKRRIAVGFVGNLREEMYTKTAISSFFNLVERTEAINNIRDHFKDTVTIPESADGYIGSKTIQLLIGGFGHSHIPSSHPRNYLRFLSECDFFIALPGVNIPFCHNLIESMMCGCIPIIQYGKFMPVPLKNDVNCLAYDSIPSLLSIIKRAIQMDTKEKLMLRNGVKEYYTQHLSLQARKNLFKNDLSKISTLYFTSTDVSLSLYDHPKHDKPNQ